MARAIARAVGGVGYAVDVGASDGVSINATYDLEGAGWTVLCVEPNPFFAPLLKRERAFVEICACADYRGIDHSFFVHLDNPEAFSGLKRVHHPRWHPDPGARFETIKVRVETLDHLLAKWEFPRLDALKVDTEGTELDVLRGLDLERWKPRIIVAESWDEETPITNHLAPFGYRKVDRVVVANVYLREAE